MATTHIAFGPACLKLSGPAVTIDYLAAELGGTTAATGAQHDVEVRLVSESEYVMLLRDANLSQIVGPARANAHSLEVAGGAFRWYIAEGTPLRVYACPIRTVKQRVARLAPRSVQRLATRKYRTAMEQEAIHLLHEVVLWSVQTALLRHNASFVHASCVGTADNRALLLMGSGGCGKTSASASLLLEHPDEWLFMADDLAIVDTEGGVWLTPMPIHVYPYNLVGGTALRHRILRDAGALDRCHWQLRSRLLGPLGVCRRIQPETLYNLGSCRQQVTVGIFLERHAADRFTVAALSHGSAAARSTAILQYELRKALPAMLLRDCAIHDEASAIGLSAIVRRTHEVLYAACTGMRLHRLIVPNTATPADLASRVRSLWTSSSDSGDRQQALCMAGRQ